MRQVIIFFLILKYFLLKKRRFSLFFYLFSEFPFPWMLLLIFSCICVIIVIFFDWDDTLFPSTFLASKGFRLDTHPDRFVNLLEPLQELESCVLDVLRLAMSFGTVIIITNAEQGWVQLSAEVISILNHSFICF